MKRFRHSISILLVFASYSTQFPPKPPIMVSVPFGVARASYCLLIFHPSGNARIEFMLEMKYMLFPLLLERTVGFEPTTQDWKSCMFPSTPSPHVQLHGSLRKELHIFPFLP